jgi:hypothetical protein
MTLKHAYPDLQPAVCLDLELGGNLYLRGLYVHGNTDPGGAARAVESITTGLQRRRVRPPVCITGPPRQQDLQACWSLARCSRPRSPDGRSRCRLVPEIAGLPVDSGIASYGDRGVTAALGPGADASCTAQVSLLGTLSRIDWACRSTSRVKICWA